MELSIQRLVPAHWPAVLAIYEEGIATGDATFDTAPPGWPAWDRGHLAGHRLLASRDGRVVGWAALSPVSERCAYAGVADPSHPAIYLPGQELEGGNMRAFAAKTLKINTAGSAADSRPCPTAG